MTYQLETASLKETGKRMVPMPPNKLYKENSQMVTCLILSNLHNA